MADVTVAQFAEVLKVPVDRLLQQLDQAGIKVDGADIRSYTLTGLRRNIGVVFQETLLFNRSIADNLRVGKPDATDAEIREVWSLVPTGARVVIRP